MSSCLLLALAALWALYAAAPRGNCFECAFASCGCDTDDKECGTDAKTTSCLINDCPSDTLGCCRINSIKWTCASPVCECETEEALHLVENGYETWRSCPVQVAARFLNRSEIPCAFRGKPAYLKDITEYCSKRYVLLGVSCVGDIAFELTPVSCGDTEIFTVCRFAVIC